MLFVLIFIVQYKDNVDIMYPKLIGIINIVSSVSILAESQHGTELAIVE